MGCFAQEAGGVPYARQHGAFHFRSCNRAFSRKCQRSRQLPVATPGQPTGCDPTSLLDQLGVEGHAALDFCLFVRVTKPTASANEDVRRWAVCLMQGLELVTESHGSTLLPWSAGLDHSHDPDLDRLWKCGPRINHFGQFGIDLLVGVVRCGRLCASADAIFVVRTRG